MGYHAPIFHLIHVPRVLQPRVCFALARQEAGNLGVLPYSKS